MKKHWIAAVITCMFTLGSMAQTSAGGSASGNASVTPGQTGASANASQSAQTSGVSANSDASANAQAAHEKGDQKGKDKQGKKEKSSTSAAGSGSGSAAVAAGDSSALLSGGSTLQAELTKPVDAKKAKSGDEVTARLTQDIKSNGQVVLHKGSKLVGHVTEAQAKSKDNAESKLGIVFDKAVGKGSQEVAFNGVIQALAPPAQGALSVAGDESGNLGSGMGSGMGSSRSNGSGGPLGSVGSTAGSAVGTVNNTAGAVTNATGAVNGSVNNTLGAAANGTINSASHGVVGLQGLALNTAAAGNAQGSVISSTSRNVKLDTGTQLVLQVTGSAAAQ
ncbi:MAG TPA: hypothetical protein VKL99_04050 [Candidatus Angelobacter sp.]|nr:hypothetical protein [Candidatus Angelobacter sp.]